jgi:hypothetical protein
MFLFIYKAQQFLYMAARAEYITGAGAKQAYLPTDFPMKKRGRLCRMYPYTGKEVDFSDADVPVFEIFACVLQRGAGCAILKTAKRKGERYEAGSDRHRQHPAGF